MAIFANDFRSFFAVRDSCERYIQKLAWLFLFNPVTRRYFHRIQESPPGDIENARNPAAKIPALDDGMGGELPETHRPQKMISITPQSHPDYKNLQFTSISLSNLQLTCTGIRTSLISKCVGVEEENKHVRIEDTESGTHEDKRRLLKSSGDNKRKSHDPSSTIPRKTTVSGRDSGSSSRENSRPRLKSVGNVVSSIFAPYPSGPVPAPIAKRVSARDVHCFSFLQSEIRGLPPHVVSAIPPETPCVFSGMLREHNRHVCLIENPDNNLDRCAKYICCREEL